MRRILPLMLLLAMACTPKLAKSPDVDGGAVELQPANPETESRLADLEEAFRQGDSARARVLAVDFLDKHPDHRACADLRLRLARDYYSESRFDLALHHLGMLDEEHPGGEPWQWGQLLRARVLAERGDLLEAALLLDERLQEASLGALEESARARMAELIERGLREGELREFLHRRPNSEQASRAKLALAERHLAVQRPAEAEPLLKAVLADPQAGALRDRARGLLERKATGSELVELQQAGLRPDRVGLLVPLTGRFSVYGEAFLEGARMALSRTKTLGAGPIEIVVADTKGEPVAAALAARELITVQSVGCLLGEVLTNPTVAAAVEANARGVPMLSPSATAEDIHELGEWIFQNSITTEAQVLALARHAVFEILAARFAVLYPRQGKGQDLALHFSEIIHELGGEMVASVTYDEGMTDFSEPLAIVGEAQPEVLFLPGEADQLMLIVPQLDYHDIYGQILGNEAWNSRRLARMGGPRVEGAIFPSDLLLDRDRPLFREFSLLYEQSTGREPNPIAARSFLGMTILLEILQDGADSREAIREQLALRLQMQGLSKERLETLAQQVTFMTIHEGEIRSYGSEELFRLD